MSIKLKGSTAGSVALDAPANTSPSGSDIALTLPIDAGSAGQYLRNSSTAGTLEFADTVTRATPVDLSGTSVTFTGISSSCKRIQILIKDISSDSTDQPRIRLGHAGSGGTFVNTGYAGAMGFIATSTVGGSTMPTDSFAILTSGFAGAANTNDSIIDICNVKNNIWVYRCISGLTSGLFTIMGGGHVDVGATLDRLQIFLSGSGNFDDGTVTILTED